MRFRYASQAALLLSVGLLLGGCSSISVYAEANPALSMPPASSFAWGESTLPGDAFPTLSSELVEGRIHAAVEREMTTRGFRASSDGNAPLLVDFHLATRQQFQTVTTYHEESRWEERQDFSYTEGTLVVDILRASDGALIWRGWATGVVEQGSPERAQSRLDEAIRKMFEKLPPPW